MKARMLEYLTSTFTVFRARMETRDCEVPSSAGELHRDRKEIAKGPLDTCLVLTCQRSESV